MPSFVIDDSTANRIRNACDRASEILLQETDPRGWWVGKLSTSALSTATAVMALELAHRSSSLSDQRRYQSLIAGGLQWLADHQNDDGGWGDTVLSLSNISTSMLANAVFHGTSTTHTYASTVERSQTYIDRIGGVEAVLARYGKDRTFSVPILTHCALAGTVSWKRVIPLPFEMACVPQKLYAAVRMPVVSYALPALIAIGQVVFHHRGHWNPLLWALRKVSRKRSMRILERIQPQHGGFLEATPLTSFVCMSLLGCGYWNHPVTRKCLQFIEASVRPDGSWPIDTNLSTWVTTLSVNALESTKPDKLQLRSGIGDSQRAAIRSWVLNQQYRCVHPYTNSPPGGWSWTDLPGGVPDADDTPGAILALLKLRKTGEAFSDQERDAIREAVEWLLGLQNRDGGWPTFCRGWGTLPFDRSSNDLTAHVLRAFLLWEKRLPEDSAVQKQAVNARRRGIRYLKTNQADDGSWLPLWFGNQFHENEENPLYGTAKVILMLREYGAEREYAEEATEILERGIVWLLKNQNADGSWGAVRGLEGSVEETSLAVEALAGTAGNAEAVISAANWLCQRIEAGTFTNPAPIGFYFAKLWYFEHLYPIIFSVAALRRCVEKYCIEPDQDNV